MLFYVGLHHPYDARLFERCMVSINSIRDRKGPFPANEWIMDSGAFMELKMHGRYRDEPEVHARHILRWADNGNLVAAASQDYMCEPLIIHGGTIIEFGKAVHVPGTKLSVAEHQRLTIERYDRIKAVVRNRVYVMPVLQGYDPHEYVSHLGQYGRRLRKGAWVGVGSVCKRNGDVEEVENVLMAIRGGRPDLRFHSSDSMAWSFAARRSGGDRNSPKTAMAFVETIATQAPARRDFQRRLF